jgi:hypothetical protein
MVQLVQRSYKAHRREHKDLKGVTTPSRPQGLQPTGALACTYRKNLPTLKKPTKRLEGSANLQASAYTPLNAHGLHSVTVISGT